MLSYVVLLALGVVAVRELLDAGLFRAIAVLLTSLVLAFVTGRRAGRTKR